MEPGAQLQIWGQCVAQGPVAGSRIIMLPFMVGGGKSEVGSAWSPTCFSDKIGKTWMLTLNLYSKLTVLFKQLIITLTFYYMGLTIYWYWYADWPESIPICQKCVLNFDNLKEFTTSEVLWNRALLPNAHGFCEHQHYITTLHPTSPSG